ncbi:MAG: S8 family peptidase [Lachnospiraceae bacterium]|nr:S8 family peptidase [Butyrivibrio sp.]MCM1345205.1 S8 family peptidase [Muribaculaceae bacterium]MCM1412422.1 S8 family peptidase [Lachnospiraceae bacterium]
MPVDCRENILSEEYYDVILDFPMWVLGSSAEGLCHADIGSDYTIVYFPINLLMEAEDYFFSYRSIPKIYGLMQEGGSIGGFDPNSLIDSGITQIQREPLALTGRGVVICVIDTGIDYTSPVFRNEDGSSRILAIWDQTIQTGNPPEGFQYGTEYTREDINRALQSEDPYSVVPSRDEIGHGSALASAAAGSKLNGGFSFQGAAPDADIVVVKLKQCKQYLRQFYLVPGSVPAYQENDIMLAVQYVDSFVDTFSRPVVICLGLGTNYGDHTGSSPLGRYLNSIAVKRSRAVVVAGGNEGSAGHHFQGQLASPASGGTNVAAVEVRVVDGAEGFFLELWGSLPDVYTVSVRTPGGERIRPIRLGINDAITYSFIYERSRVTIAGFLVEPASGEELVVMRVQDPTPGIWTFQVEAAADIHNGEFNMWLPITQFLSAPVYFLEPSPYITLTEPSLASNVICVSTYDATNDSFYINSGRGYSRCGTIRPDLAAPGVNVSTLNGRESNSSLAAAITTGAVAQFMQWAVVEQNNGVVESQEIKSYLIRGASRSIDMTYPNREWGYGRLNMVGTFDALIGV